MNNQNIANNLHKIIRNSYVLALKTQNFHWNVAGPNFKSLHDLFSSQYEDLSEAIDDLAERIRALDILVPARFDLFLGESEIKNGSEKSNWQVMVKELCDDNKELSKMINICLREVQKEGDEATADMLIERAQVHDKNAWMLKSSL